MAKTEKKTNSKAFHSCHVSSNMHSRFGSALVYFSACKHRFCWRVLHEDMLIFCNLLPRPSFCRNHYFAFVTKAGVLLRTRGSGIFYFIPIFPFSKNVCINFFRTNRLKCISNCRSFCQSFSRIVRNKVRKYSFVFLPNWELAENVFGVP